MRSSVVDAQRLPEGGNRSAGYKPVFQPPMPGPRRSTTKLASRSLPRRLTPVEGWSPLFFLAIALYSVVWLTSVAAFHINWLLLLGGLRSAITGTVMTGTMPTSEIVFFFYLAFLCFFLGYFGSWLVYRAHLPWLVALVYCSILLVNLNYVKQDLAYLVIILVGA